MITVRFQIKNKVQNVIESADSLKAIEDVRIAFLGKKGELTSILKGMKDLSNEERPMIGKLANDVRQEIESLLSVRKEAIAEIEEKNKIKSEKIDVTVPGVKREIGKKHPITQALDELKDIFIGMGYQIAEGPEVELDYYNFEALNIPKNHPARDTQDTFYVSDDVVLRTHTSPVQIRTMENSTPPLKIICPGRVYRSDTIDATHGAIFHQVEGLVVDKGINMGNLKGTLAEFARRMFGDKTKVRFRPHHFQFTEPSAEVDVSCFVCNGEGCSVCKGEGWIEILGAGMVHPKVLKAGGIDPDVYSGFAFGMGVERIVMTKYGINDMRMFMENDLRFLKQF